MGRLVPIDLRAAEAAPWFRLVEALDQTHDLDHHARGGQVGIEADLDPVRTVLALLTVLRHDPIDQVAQAGHLIDEAQRRDHARAVLREVTADRDLIIDRELADHDRFPVHRGERESLALTSTVHHEHSEVLKTHFHFPFSLATCLISDGRSIPSDTRPPDCSGDRCFD